jgi:hypothetical protein
MPVYYLSQETEGQRSRKIPALIGGLITVLILAVAAAIIAYYVTRPDDAVLTSSNAAGATQPTIVESPDIGAAFSNTVEADTNTIYVVDTSDSMKFDLDKVQDSLVSLTDEEDFSRNRVRLMTFDTGVGTAFDFDLMESPGSREDFREAVNSLETAAYSRYSNSTMMYLGIQRAHDELVKLADYDRPNRIVVFTDGAADDHHLHYDRLLEEVQNSPIPNLRIDVIGYGLDPTITYFPNEVLEELPVAWGAGGDDPSAWTAEGIQWIERNYGMSQREFIAAFGTPILAPIHELTSAAGGKYIAVDR